jgi:hypothetical protein
VVSRSGTGRRGLSRQRGAAEKQVARLHGSPHAYRAKDREERVGEVRIPVVHPAFLASSGRGSKL